MIERHDTGDQGQGKEKGDKEEIQEVHECTHIYKKGSVLGLYSTVTISKRTSRER
jgi:hypothetical protein